MSIWNWIEGGNSQPLNDTRGRRFSCRFGRWIAGLRKGVTVDPTARVSPEARICARGQSIVIGPDCLVAQGAMLQGTVRLGRNCSVQAYTILTGYKDAGITVGDNVRIASHCMMVAGNHRFDDPNRPICQQGLGDQAHCHRGRRVGRQPREHHGGRPDRSRQRSGRRSRRHQGRAAHERRGRGSGPGHQKAGKQSRHCVGGWPVSCLKAREKA